MKQLSMSCAPVSPRVEVSGELLDRLLRSFDRLEQQDYSPDQCLIRPDGDGWHGDYVGRTILALANLSRVTGRSPKHLAKILSGLPECLNEQGYLGPVPVDGVLSEQQFSGHGWLVSGLIVAGELTGDNSVSLIAQKIVENLFGQMNGRMRGYPVRPEDRLREGNPSGETIGQVDGWLVSSDIGCAFIALEGLVEAYALWPCTQWKTLIDEMLEAFVGIDLIAASMQLHASLTAARQFLQYYTLGGPSEALDVAQRVYALFRSEAMTENFANWNWFGRPTHTEPCAIVDSLILSVELWRSTGDPSYLEDAHAIYYNAMGYAQKPHGGFGLENCIGADGQDWLFNKCYDVFWCCNMRGAVGLSRMADYAYIVTGPSTLTLPFYFDSLVDVSFSSGAAMRLTQNTGYPYEGTAKLTVEYAAMDKPVTLRLFAPSWSRADEVCIKVNGKPDAFLRDKGFVCIERKFCAGDTVEITFGNGLRRQSCITKDAQPAAHTLRHGPLILGTKCQDGAPSLETLSAVGDAVYEDSLSGVRVSPIGNVSTLSDEDARSDRRRLLFS